MSGPSLLILGGSNTWSGGASVYGGTLQIGYGANGADSYIASGGTLSLYNGATLQLAPLSSTTIGAVIGHGDSQPGRRRGHWPRPGQPRPDQQQLQRQHPLAGGTLSIAASGTLGSGQLVFNGGVLQLPVSITSSATLDALNGGVNGVNWSTFNGGFDTGLIGTTAFVLGDAISGNGNLIENGAGTMVIAQNDPSFTGTTSINAGTLQLNTTGSLGQSTVAVNAVAGLTFAQSGANALARWPAAAAASP